MNILICGGGALGSHTLMLAKDLPAKLSVVDFDRVETKNLSNQWFVKQMIGKNKASALKAQLFNFYGIRITDYGVQLTEQNITALSEGVDLIVDCFDNASSRRLVQHFAREKNIASIHAGLAADGAFGIVRWNKDFVVDEEDIPGQPTCEGGEFLPLISMVSAALVKSIQIWMNDTSPLNWNISPLHAESF